MGHIDDSLSGGPFYPERETTTVPLERMIFTLGLVIGSGSTLLLLVILGLILSILRII